MTDHRYANILARCLEHEDKAHRDAVLAEYDHDVAQTAHHLMQGLARRLATSIIYTGRKPPLPKDERRALRNMRLGEIQPSWLQDRVKKMVIEAFEQ